MSDTFDQQLADTAESIRRGVDLEYELAAVAKARGWFDAKEDRRMTPYQHDRAARDRRREAEYDFGAMVPISWAVVIVFLGVVVFG